MKEELEYAKRDKKDGIEVFKRCAAEAQKAKWELVVNEIGTKKHWESFGSYIGRLLRKIGTA